MNQTRITAEQAGYLELPGAVKDADCEIVEVDGGVSSERGCCNSFGIKPESDSFRCGECKYLSDQENNGEEETPGQKPLGRKEARSMSDEELLNSERPVVVEPKRRR